MLILTYVIALVFSELLDSRMSYDGGLVVVSLVLLAVVYELIIILAYLLKQLKLTMKKLRMKMKSLVQKTTAKPE